MSELINFRDFGGLDTIDGKTIKKGIFYRSGSYRDLLKEDRDYIKSLKIKNLHDYREAIEVDKDEKQIEMTENFHPISASAHLGLFELNTEEEVVVIDDESMIEFYKRLPFDNPAYKHLFKTLMQEDAVPLLHNCTAGKDRTGIATALIQLSLGARMDSVFLDYMKSMDAYEYILQNEKRRLNGHSECSLMNKLSGLIIKPAYLQASFDEIVEKYGGFDQYFEVEFSLGVKERETLKDRYTE